MANYLTHEQIGCLPCSVSLVLDLDEMLVTTRHSQRSAEKTGLKFHKIIFASFDRVLEETIYLVERPGLAEFLDFCFENFNVGVWSAGQPEYVKKVVKTIFPRTPFFVYDWTHCTRKGPCVYKRLCDCPFPYEKTFLLDDTETITEEKNRLIHVPKFRGKRTDNVLACMKVHLSQLR